MHARLPDPSTLPSHSRGKEEREREFLAAAADNQVIVEILEVPVLMMFSDRLLVMQFYHKGFIGIGLSH